MEILALKLRSYLEICRTIFDKYRISNSTNKPLSEEWRLSENNRSNFRNAVVAAEATDAFAAFAQDLDSHCLSDDLNRLSNEENERRVKRQTSGSQRNRVDIDISQWRNSEVRKAAHHFFVNTGAYLSIWSGEEFDESRLLQSIESSKIDSEYLRLFVFDGFVFYDDEKLLKNISLPVGDLRIYDEKELADLFRLPKISWHDHKDTLLLQKINSWHVLTVRKHEEYRGNVSWWHNLFDDTFSNSESDIGFIAPIFLCVGEIANLAEEIRVRTNVFDATPVDRNPRNGYLTWDDFDSEGNERPRRVIKSIGNEGIVLRKFFSVWEAVNRLSSKGFLLYPSQSYVRSLMNWHTSNNFMDIFVSLITTMESLLTHGDSADLSYKLAIRAAALLSHDATKRMDMFQKLKEWYRIRSKIVHEGHSKGKDPYEIIKPDLLRISRQLFLRYITLLHLAGENDLQNSLLPNAEFLKNCKKRPEAVSKILDAAVIDPRLTIKIEEALEQWGMDDC
ncbi:hypothetical protein HUU39_17470 [candidate division KSB1 bacterium]|nr:hypothetical protein [bacterium]NUM67028.1 hypothetical protein [candidate division KSB1 bacterium]